MTIKQVMAAIRSQPRGSDGKMKSKKAASAASEFLSALRSKDAKRINAAVHRWEDVPTESTRGDAVAKSRRGQIGEKTK